MDKIAVIGLGYVGLPLAVEFGKQRKTIGFDINEERIVQLRAGKDSTREVEPKAFDEAKELSFTSNVKDIDACDIYIVTVPTPIDIYRQPDLRPLKAASEAVGKVLSTGN
ncbi:MAG: Vi polysaccharide biosynthesis UDP-N-acetylglucosamine C-6 dehydrogenase TviB, partial [Fulvivirga sp.]|nr:Vi polysaccharide biosynthesis UDP-N-acetylglucosamine C-6 dehydrogenase TviB [Fulvivirga sp.]